MKIYCNNLVTVTDSEKVKLESVIDRIPDFIDEDVADGSTDLRTAVRFSCQDFSGNLLLPSYQMSRPGSNYYASKLHLYSFVICDISTNVYDQCLAGIFFDAMCSLRLLHHLSERQKLRISLGPEPNQLFQCMDNNVGQNRSQVVFIYFPWANNSCALDSTLTALWIIYVKLRFNIERLAISEAEYPEIVEVFVKLYHGRLHNIEAKKQFLKMFKDIAITDERYKEQKYVELNLITNNFKARNVVLNSVSSYQFVFNREIISFTARSSEFSVQESLNTYVYAY